VALIVMLGGMTAVGLSVHAMMALGLVMMVIYGYLVASPLRRLRAEVAAGVWERAGAAMGQVRRLVAVNLLLGLLTLTIAVFGRG